MQTRGSQQVLSEGAHPPASYQEDRAEARYALGSSISSQNMF